MVGQYQLVGGDVTFFVCVLLSVFVGTALSFDHHDLLTRGFKHTRELDGRRRLEVALGQLSSIAPAPSSLEIIASPTTPTATIANLTVTWSGAPDPRPTDWIAIYCTDASISDWQEWDYVNAAEGWSSGAGRLSFVQARTDCALEFRMYRDPSPYTFVGKSNSVSWPGAGTGQPYQQRIAYGYHPQTMMTVAWTSMNETKDALVMVGLASGNYNLGNFTPAPATTYYAADSCAEPATKSGPGAWRFPGYFYFANVSGLTAGTRYYAKAVVNGHAGAEMTFVTGKPVGPDVDTRFVMYGDMSISGAPGAVETSFRITDRITQQNDIDFLLHVGDLAYGLGDVAVWDTWMGYIEPVSGAIPYMVSIGNHEYCYAGTSSNDPSGVDHAWNPVWRNCENDSQGECGVGTNKRFVMPNNGNQVFWYSFSVGNVHIAMLSSEHDMSVGSPMGDWLIRDLDAVDRRRTPWVLVAIHRPLVETEAYAGDYLVAQNYLKIMNPYMLASKVDVVLAGHYHAFQRSCYVGLNYSCVEGPNGGIVHYTSGAAGATLDDVGLYGDPVIEKSILGTFGYSVLHAPNASALRLQFFANKDNSLLDDAWLYKQ